MRVLEGLPPSSPFPDQREHVLEEVLLWPPVSEVAGSRGRSTGREELPGDDAAKLAEQQGKTGILRVKEAHRIKRFYVLSSCP